jgi:hypothetical protein
MDGHRELLSLNHYHGFFQRFAGVTTLLILVSLIVKVKEV